MLKCRINRPKGQSLVETALILPIVILILTGIIDFGLMFNNYLVITNASRDGARSAVVGKTDTDIKTEIRNMTSTLDQSKLTITIYPAESLRKKGDNITVTVTYDYHLLTPIIGALIPNPIHLSSQMVMRIE